MIAAGKYEAIAIQSSQVTQNEKSGKEEIRVLFQLDPAEDGKGGETITWYGYFTEKTAERTLESLRYMGWAGDDVTDIQGLDKNKVQLVIEHDEYQGKTKAKVAWVNRLQAVYMGTPMGGDAKASFAKRMKGLVIASKQAASSSPNASKGGAGQGNDDFPHGHNEKPKVDL
jgi:hypothetical protein